MADRIRVEGENSRTFYEVALTEDRTPVTLFRGTYTADSDHPGDAILEVIEPYALPASVACKLQDMGIEF